MPVQTITIPELTDKCKNFRDYLANTFQVTKYGNFLAAVTYPIAEIEQLLSDARAAGRNPVSVRVYYGCDDQGTNHELILVLVDANGDIIQAASIYESISEARTVSAERRCPPGCQRDSIMEPLLN
jgi:hypothetical protein